MLYILICITEGPDCTRRQQIQLHFSKFPERPTRTHPPSPTPMGGSYAPSLSWPNENLQTIFLATTLPV